jgi:hypothetical protein
MKTTLKTIAALTGLLLGTSFSSFSQNILQSTGDAGVGTTTPTRKFQIHNTTSANQMYISSVSPSIFFGDNSSISTASQTGIVSMTTEANKFAFGTAPGDMIMASKSGKINFVTGAGLVTSGFVRMTVNSNGNVGIGTASPIASLQVNGWGLFTTSTGSPTSAALIRANSTYSTPTTPDFTWWNNDQVGLFHPAPNVIGFTTLGAERMRVDGNGNVGIGTATPKAPLNVAGANAEPTIAATANGVFFVGGTNTNTALTMGVYTTGVASSAYTWMQSRNQALADNYFPLKINPLGGKVVIGNVTTPGDYGLYVQKGILTERVKVAVATSADWADYVFAKEYKLKSINELETFVKENKHLPNVPSAEEVVKEGVDMAKMDAKLLEKIEELTLYVIQQQKEIELLKQVKKQ